MAAVAFTPETVDRLEDGHIVLAAEARFTLRPDEHPLLRPALMGRAKNISLAPEGTLKHTTASGRDRVLLQAMMARYAAWATALVQDLVPHYRGRLVRARTSFRPAEIEGRRCSVLQDDSRLHVDAFPTTPMGGRRILRVFANVNPQRPRIWNAGEPFADMARRFLPQARVAPAAVHGALALLRLTKGRRTPYDDVMLALHDGAKRDAHYQAHCPKMQHVFPPGAVWLCFTDVVMHAAVKGQHALEQSFHLPVEAMAKPEKSPLRILEEMMGRPLA